jgi:hypothetical protein
MFDYQYPQVTSGYRWNILERVKNEVGIEPINLSDVSISDVWYTVVSFDRELTAEEKTKLDTTMADNPGFPPTEPTNTVYNLKDIYETRLEFSTVLGNLPFFIYYNESTPGAGFDRIQLHFKKGLSQAEKNKVKDEFSKLLTVKSN